MIQFVRDKGKIIGENVIDWKKIKALIVRSFYRVHLRIENIIKQYSGNRFDSKAQFYIHSCLVVNDR